MDGILIYIALICLGVFFTFAMCAGGITLFAAVCGLMSRMAHYASND